MAVGERVTVSVEGSADIPRALLQVHTVSAGGLDGGGGRGGGGGGGKD